MRFLYKMPKKDLQLWLNSLRGGEYSQARYRLKSDEGFCCLGVACDLGFTGNGKWEEWVDSNPPAYIYVYENAEVAYTRPIYLMRSIETNLNSDELYFTLEDLPVDLQYKIHRYLHNNSGTLSMLNDMGASFSLIADVIESLVYGEE